jgi:hypothetical protein
VRHGTRPGDGGKVRSLPPPDKGPAHAPPPALPPRGVLTSDPWEYTSEKPFHFEGGIHSIAVGLGLKPTDS